MGNSSIPMRAFLLVLLMICSVMLPFIESAPEEESEEIPEYEKPMFTSGNGATFGPQTISIGNSFNMCMIFANGTPMCKGQNLHGQLGDGTNSYSSDPVNVLIPEGSKAKSIDTDYSSTCMVLDNGSAMCWGRNDERGQLGLGDELNRNSPEYVILPTGAEVKSIEVSRYSSCMLLTNGSVMCAGSSRSLGNGNNGHSNISQFVTLPAGRTMVQISHGYWRTCGVLDNASAMCWGSAYSGGLGDGTSDDSDYPVYVQTPNGINVKSISVGYAHVCMVLLDGSISCWGENDNGELGDGTNNTSYSAVSVSLPSTVSANRVSAGYDFTCADFDDGTVRCWGKGANGRLGNGQAYSTGQYESEPVNVSMPNGVDVLNLTIGNSGACTLNSNLSATCWGSVTGTNTPGFTYSSFLNHYAKPGDLIPHPDCLVDGTDNNTMANWVMCAGGVDGTAKVYGTDVDSSGNVFYAGIFSGTVFFGEQVLKSSGTDSFVAKLSNDGEWLWASQIGGSGDAQIRDLAVSSSGDIAVTGYFANEAVIGETDLNSSGANDVFVAKLNSAGDWIWAKSFGGSYNDLGHENTFDSNGNIYVTGLFSGTLPFSASSQTALGTYDVFVAKFSSIGGQLSFNSAGGTGSQTVGYSISVSSNGEAHVSGKFNGTSTFGSSSVTSNGGFDMFKATLSSSGSWSSIISAGGTGDDDAHVISVDSSGNSYITGHFENSFSLSGTTLTSNGDKDIFVAKLSSSNSWSWVNTAGGSGADKGNGIDFDSNGNAIVTGLMSGTVSIAGSTLISNGQEDAFIGQLNSSGAWVWVNNGGSSGIDKIYDISVDSNGIGYVGGYINGDAHIGPQNFTCAGTCAIMIKTPVIQSPPADGDISVDLEFDYVNMRLKGNWQASNLVTGHDYNVSWILKYQNNGSQISNGWPDSFNPSTSSYSSTDRTWSSGFTYGEAICYEVVLRDGDGFTGPSLDTATSCTRTPVQLTELSSTEVVGAVQRSSAGNCAANSGNNQGNICDGNTGSSWVSEDNYPAENLNIDFDLGTSAVKVNGVAAYVNTPDYTSTIKDVRLKFVNETGEYETIGVFKIERETGWQYFGGFSVMTTEIRWDVLSNHGFGHTVLFEGKVLDIPDKIFNSTADWNSIESENSHSVALGDVDGDGDLDLAVANALQNNRLYLNNGNNFSTSPVWTSSNSLNSRDMAWGDVDGDGDLDLAVANHNGKNEIYFNSGTGLATTPGWQSSNSWSSVSVSWGDIDGDGDLDLAVGNQAHQNEVYLNDGSTLGTNSYWTSSNSLNTNSAIWGDVDGDGDLDLAVGSYDTNNEVYLNDGSTLENTPSWTSSNSQYTLMLAWGDIDGDGDLDLAVGNRHQSNEIYLNTGTSLSTTPSFVTTETTSTNWISLGDLDGDGNLDMIAGNREHASTNSSSSNQVYFNSGSILQSSAAWTGNARETYGTALGDVDGDGDLDLVVANKNSESNELYFNQLDNGGAGADGLPDIDIGGPGDSEFSGKNLATGYSHNCAIQKNQTISCWGSNQYGQLGSDQYDFYDYSSPLYDVDLPQGTVPISVTAGWDFTCAILSGSSTDVYCWGRGEYGRLGNGDYSDSSIPEDKVELPGGAYPVDVSSGLQHSCLVSQDGDVYCWGSNSHGQLGNGTSGGYSSTAGIVNGPDVDYTSVAVGEHHSCALTTEDDLYCWGHNGQGQLGDGTWSSSATPVLVSGSITWKSVVPNGMARHSCAISSSDELYCWGSNGDGRLGDGSYSDANTPQLVQLQSSATSKVVDASVGSFGTSCAVLEDSSTYCWGINARGYLGDGTWQDSMTPVSVSLPEGSEVLEISSGREHSCVLLASDQIMCWGFGNWGVIGNGKYDDTGHPNYVSGEREWNGLGKDFYHLPTSVSIGTDNSVPKLESSVSFTSLPTSLNVDISSRVYFSHGQQILLFSPTEVEQNQPVNGLSWSNEYSFHDELPSISGGNDYCIEIHLNSNLTGDSIGYGLDCVWYNPPSSQDDFAPDDFEDVWGTSTNTQDSDGDGYEDWFEYWFGGDPLDSEVKPSDADMDGLPDALELAINSDENSADTDGDGHEDIDELIYGGHPLKPWTVPPNYDYDDCYDYWENWNGLNTSNSDTDGDGVIDCLDTDSLDPDNTPEDSDGDGMPDDMEEEFGSDPENWDSDGDGMPDSFEYIMDTDPNSDQSWSHDWAMDWSTVLSFGQDVSITASSSHSEHPASLAIDSNSDTNGNQETYWQTNGYCPATLEVDLGRAQYFSIIDFLVKDIGDQNFPRNISIEYRETTEDTWNLHAYWERNAPGANGDYWDGMYAEMPFSKARYVRLNCTDSTDSESNSWEIAIASFRVYGIKNAQYINPDGGSGGEAGQPSVEAFLNIDPANQTLTAGYSAQLNEGLDYDIEWRLIEANEGSCSDVPLSIDQGTVNLRSWDTASNGTFQQIPVDYSTISDWYDEFCLQLDLMQGGTSLDVDWLFIDASGGQNNGGNGSNQTQTDTDGDGVDDIIDLCAGTAPGVQVDSTGCPIGDPTTHNTTISVEFIEQKVDGIWNQKIELLVEDPWRGYNHSLSFKLEDSNGNTLYSYFSPIDEDAQDGWWILFTDSDEDEIEWKLDLNWEGVLEGGYWQSSSRFFEDVEYPYFEAGEYCVEVSLGYQINASDTAMSAVKNLADKLQFCGTFEHDSMDGVSWDGVIEPEQGLIDKVASNAVVSAVMDFMNSTTGQIISILLGVLAFAGRMVLARGQRAKNKRVRKISQRIRKAETIGRLKIIEMDVEKANDKNKLPRGGYGDLMEQIEARMEKLGFDGNPQDGGTSGDWSSDEGANEWQDDFQQAADMMWDAQDMMAEAREEAAMARQAIEEMQQQMGHTPQRASAKQEPEPEEAFSSRYVTSGIDSSAAGASGPSLPSSRIMDLDGDGVVSEEEKEIWNAMTQEERAEFFSPITNIAEEIRRRQILNEKREKMNKKRGGGKKDKKRKKGKKDKRW